MRIIRNTKFSMKKITETHRLVVKRLINEIENFDLICSIITIPGSQTSKRPNVQSVKIKPTFDHVIFYEKRLEKRLMLEANILKK